MGFMNNIRIAIQVSFIAVLALIGFIVIGVFYYNGSVTQDAIREDQNKATKGAALAAELQFDLTNARLRETAFLLDHDLKEVEEHKAILAEATPQIDEMRAFHDEPAMRDLLTEITSTIAAAVEEQGAATQEIARNVEQAASGTNEVSSNISGVTQAAGEAGAASSQVLEAAEELGKNSATLKTEVAKFIDQVRNG